MYDKVNDPQLKDNLVTDRNYCQGGLFDYDVPDNQLNVELSQDNGKTYQPLPGTSCNVTMRAESSQLGGRDRRLIQLLTNVPADTVGDRAWVLRLRAQ